MRAKIKQTLAVDKGSAAFLRSLLNDFEIYYKEAFRMSSEMIEGTADFSTIGEHSKNMSAMLTKLQGKLNKFQGDRYSSFTHAFESVNDKASSTATLGLIVGAVTIILLFAIAVPIAHAIRGSLKDIIDS